MTRYGGLAALTAFILLATSTALAQPGRAASSRAPEQRREHADAEEGGKQESAETNAAPQAAPAGKQQPITVTRHETTIAGQTVRYTATAGTLPLANDADKTIASVFFIAYTRDNQEGSPDANRPLTFCFNGGPGSSSVWLHLGMFGPRRVKLRDDARSTPPPYELVTNEHSLLDVTDLVFIDPVSTGYSRPAPGEKKEQFHGYSEDIHSVGQFVHLYTTRFGRWASPRFLAGESYGTLRAAGLAEHLHQRYNMSLSGIVLVSTVIDFQTIAFESNNNLPYIVFLPSYTATAWYHQRLDDDLQRDLEAAVAEAREFAFGPYASALLKGSSLGRQERREVAREMARLTGLSQRYLERANLRVSMSRFSAELLEGRQLTVGRFDSRYTGPSADPVDDSMDYDPSASAIFPAYTESLYRYMHGELKVRRDDVYEILTSKVHPWNYGQFENRYVESAERLRSVMIESPYLKVFVANGYYDLATPLAAAEYSFDQMNLPEQRRKNVTMGYYPGGHMMYVHEPSLAALRGDLLKFYEHPARP